MSLFIILLFYDQRQFLIVLVSGKSGLDGEDEPLMPEKRAYSLYSEKRLKSQYSQFSAANLQNLNLQYWIYW
jgi:hypothetical protein